MSSARVTFTSDAAGVDALLHSTTGPYAQWLTRVGNQVVNAAKRRANVDTGLTRSRIEFRLELEGGTLVGYVEAKTHYSLYVHERYNPFLTDALREVVGAL